MVFTPTRSYGVIPQRRPAEMLKQYGGSISVLASSGITPPQIIKCSNVPVPALAMLTGGHSR